ncbi:DUF2281 domain-containing protein [Desulfurobacterium sp.]
MRLTEKLDLSILPEEAKKELLDFYEYLKKKYKVENNTKDQFFKSLKKHSFSLPQDYSFNREEIHERK